MPFQNHLEFISKTLPGMMLRLITDITNCDFFLGYSDGKRPIFFLPSEPFCSFLIVHPFGGTCFDELHGQDGEKRNPGNTEELSASPVRGDTRFLFRSLTKTIDQSDSEKLK
jgi:hypothetical protein